MEYVLDGIPKALYCFIFLSINRGNSFSFACLEDKVHPAVPSPQVGMQWNVVLSYHAKAKLACQCKCSVIHTDSSWMWGISDAICFVPLALFLTLLLTNFFCSFNTSIQCTIRIVLGNCLIYNPKKWEYICDLRYFCFISVMNRIKYGISLIISHHDFLFLFLKICMFVLYEWVLTCMYDGAPCRCLVHLESRKGHHFP